MADLLSILFSFQPDAPELKSNLEYDRQVRNFLSTLAQVPPNAFIKGADTGQDLLEILNPTVNTIAYLYALLYRIQAYGEHPKSLKNVPDSLRPQGTLWRKLVEFLETFDPVQVRYVGGDWRRVVEYAERVARVVGMPGVAIAPIRSAMIRLDPSTGTFTSTHLLFIRLCLEARGYVAALPILDNYIYCLPSHIPRAVQEQESSLLCADLTNSSDYITTRSGHSEKITISDVQEYYLLGAMAYLGVRKYKQALHFLEHILVSPAANIASGFMLEAYKKWILVTYLADGAVLAIPRTANSSAIKQVRAASKAYEALADAFKNMEHRKLHAQVDIGAPIWVEDGNQGLIKELVDHSRRVYVSNLQRTYSAIPVSDVANMLNQTPDQAEAYLQSLIDGRYLNARIDRVTNPKDLVVLRFFPDLTQGPLAKTEKQQYIELMEQTERTNLLAEQVRAADYRLSLTKEYLEHLRRQNRKSTPNNAGGEAMDVTWDDNAEPEEDMMADLH